MIKLKQILKENNVMSYLKTLTQFNMNPIQSNYYKWMYEKAKPITIQSYTTNKELKNKVEKFLKHYTCRKKECYQTAFNCSAETGIDYVEGYVTTMGALPITHAWNHYKGIFFDLTQEEAWKGEEHSFSDYTEIITLSSRDAIRYTLKNKVYGELILTWYQERIMKGDQTKKNNRRK